MHVAIAIAITSIHTLVPGIVPASTPYYYSDSKLPRIPHSKVETQL